MKSKEQQQEATQSSIQLLCILFSFAYSSDKHFASASGHTLFSIPVKLFSFSSSLSIFPVPSSFCFQNQIQRVCALLLMDIKMWQFECRIWLGIIVSCLCLPHILALMSFYHFLHFSTQCFSFGTISWNSSLPINPSLKILVLDKVAEIMVENGVGVKMELFVWGENLWLIAPLLWFFHMQLL